MTIPRKLPKVTFDKGLLATLGLAGLTAGGTVSNYNNYQHAVEYERRNAVRRYNDMVRNMPVEKKAGFMDTLKDYAKSLHGGYGDNGGTLITVKNTPGGQAVNFEGHDNPVTRSIHAISTLNDDPGRHKAKALGAMAVSAAATQNGVANVSKGVAEEANRAAQGLSKVTDNTPSGVASRLAMLTGIPAAAYYTLRNLDRPKRALIGTAVTGAAALAAGAVLNSQTGTVSPEASDKIKRGVAALGAGTIGALVSTHQLQKAEDEEKLRQIAISQMSDYDKAMEINRIRTGKDMYTRYPAMTWVPFTGRLRKAYNEHHPPEPRVTPEDYNKYIRPGGVATDFMKVKIRE